MTQNGPKLHEKKRSGAEHEADKTKKETKPAKLSEKCSSIRQGAAKGKPNTE